MNLNRMIDKSHMGSVGCEREVKFQKEFKKQAAELRNLYPDADISCKFSYSGDIKKRDLDPSGFTVTATRGGKVIATRSF